MYAACIIAHIEHSVLDVCSMMHIMCMLLQWNKPFCPLYVERLEGKECVTKMEKFVVGCVGVLYNYF